MKPESDKAAENSRTHCFKLRTSQKSNNSSIKEGLLKEIQQRITKNTRKTKEKEKEKGYLGD